MPLEHYILDDNGEPVLEPDLLRWARWYETADRTVARNEVGRFVVSTVFLGINHQWLAHRPPLLYERMVFVVDDQSGAWVDSPDYDQRRYTTRKAALENHEIEVAGIEARLQLEAEGKWPDD